MYKYFTDKELACKCGCGKQGMKPQFMYWIVMLRKIYGKPLPLSSAYRCLFHPDEVGNPGAHTEGMAVDISIRGLEAVLLLCVVFSLRLLGAPFHGFGIKQKGKARFIHLDGLPTDNKLGKLRPWLLLRSQID